MGMRARIRLEQKAEEEDPPLRNSPPRTQPVVALRLQASSWLEPLRLDFFKKRGTIGESKDRRFDAGESAIAPAESAPIFCRYCRRVSQPRFRTGLI